MATMSLAPNPASVEQTGDKLSILETRLNSLQQNISVIQPSEPTTNGTGAVQQQDDASSLKANSLLARIKAAQEQRRSSPKDVVVEEEDRKISAKSASDTPSVACEPSGAPNVIVDDSLSVVSSVKQSDVHSDDLLGGIMLPTQSTEDKGTAVVNSITTDKLELFECEHNTKEAVNEIEDEEGIVGSVDVNDVIIDSQALDGDNAMSSELIEEQRKILEQIEAEKKSEEMAMKLLVHERKVQETTTSIGNELGNLAHQTGHDFRSWDEAHGITDQASQEKNERSASPPNETPNVVDLGNGNTVKLYSQNRTLESIANGTARLVRCLNCKAKMKVTKDATLIYCPCCSSVSPVLDVESENSQEDEDYKLAVRLQKLEDMRGNSTTDATTSTQSQEESSWMDWISEKVYGSPDKQTAPTNSAQNTAHSQMPGSGQSNAGKARVAPDSGYFSCVVDSVSNLASNGYNLASNYNTDDLTFAQSSESRSSESTTVDYSPLLEEENV
mmetsp:Transcript_21508/g.27712  ORF Transcript_21508/g.27712 Transcript_21508/m.27712 type:complete len:501 (-) Transcript_21508:113-1615(-)